MRIPGLALQSKGEVSSFPAAHLAIFQATVASFIGDQLNSENLPL